MGRDVGAAARRLGRRRRMLRVVKGKVSHFQAVGHFCSMSVKDGGSQYIQFFPFFLVVLVAIVVVVADGRIFDGGKRQR